LNLNRKSIFSPTEERFRLDQKELKECYILAMALDIRLTINEDGPVESIIEKLSQLNDITDIFHKEPHHQVACLLIEAGRALKNTGLQFKGALGLKKGKSKDKALEEIYDQEGWKFAHLQQQRVNCINYPTKQYKF